MIGEVIKDVQEIQFFDEDGNPFEDIVRLRVAMDLFSPSIPAVRLIQDGRWILVK